MAEHHPPCDDPACRWSGPCARPNSASGEARELAQARRGTRWVSDVRVIPLRPIIKFMKSLYRWRYPAGLEECPYIMRWVLFPNWYSIRLHHWSASDDTRALHNHAWWFITIVLWGSYVDFYNDPHTGELTADVLRTGSIRFRHAHYSHTVQILQPTWTLLLTGRPLSRWGFWVNGKLIRRDRYFAIYGHHPCDTDGEPVRTRPDGTRIEAHKETKPWESLCDL